jgi:hypothetical protein
MMGNWTHRINVIAPAADKSALNALWTVIAPEGDSEANSFGVPLSADGSNPTTHYGISTAATDEMRMLITETFAEELSGCVVSVQDYTLNDWETLLQNNGLQAIQSEVI